MRKFYLPFTFAVSLLASLCGDAQDFSNKGKDFWVGYGYHEQMNNGSVTGGTQNMVLYFATEVVTTVTVSIPGLGYTQTYSNIPANTVFASNPIPKASPDARLNAEGIYDRGIHITSDHPIVGYAHIYNQSVSGATILYPTNTLGKEYYSVNYTNNSNTSLANCWFYVIATDTGTTTVRITPTASTLDITHPAGTPFTVNLTQGQIYNCMGTTTGNSGVDLTGSRIESIASGTGGCKRIAVFSGSGRIAISCNTTYPSSDNYMVQSLPKTAWGKHFLTVPSAYYGGGSGLPLTNNIYRICVQNPATVVMLNGSPIGTALVNNFYYQVAQTNQPLKIDADEPIMVAQYFPSQSSCSTPGGDGDPEVIYLSPVEQSINTVRWNACHPYQINQFKHYINVIIPSGGTAISSFKLDGVVVNPAIFSPHPQDPNYSYAVINVTGSPTNPGGSPPAGIPHTVQSDSGFNAIAYGYGSAESYGYNAGTNVRDLYQFIQIANPYATVNFPAACQGQQFYFSIVFPYQPTQIVWDFFGLFPTVTQNSPIYDSTWIINGRQLYRYTLPTPYTIMMPGTYPIQVTAQNPTTDGCSGEQQIDYSLEVFSPPSANFTFNNSGCLSDSVHFFGNPTNLNGRPIINNSWSFGDFTTASIQNPVHHFPAVGSYLVKYSIITDVGCLSDTAQQLVTINPPPIAAFSASVPQCVGQSVSFIDQSNATGSTIAHWYWNFGDGSPLVDATNGNPQTHIYNTVGTYTVTLYVQTTGGCQSVIYSQPVTIGARPVANFTFGGVCLPNGSTQFTDQSTPAGTITMWTWNFGDGSPILTGSTAAIQNPVHVYSSTGPFNVNLVVTSANGCTDNITKVMNTVFAQPHADFTMDSATSCAGNTVHFTDNLSNAPGSTVTNYYWNFGDGGTSTLQNPSHAYPTPGTYQVKHWVTSATNCMSDTMIKTVTVVALPTASFTVSNPVCQGSSITFTSTSAAGAGTITAYNWTINSVASGTTPTINHTFTTAGSYTVVLTVTTNNNCTNQTTQTITVNPKPVANFTFGGVCLPNGFTQFTDQTAPVPTSWTWDFGDGSPTSTIQNPGHVYSSTGPFNVTLNVSLNGCTDVITKLMNTVFAQPHADFTMDSATSCAGNTVHFTDNLSSAPASTVTNYFWNFGDGGTSTLQNPSHGYPTPGTYQVKHWVTSAAGCMSDTMTKTVTVVALPTASFTVSGLPLCATSTVTFTSTSTTGAGTITQYGWTVNGNPTGGNNASITYSPPAPGNYTVILTVTTSNGCSNQTTQTINVNAKPAANFNFTGACLPSGSTQFTDQSTVTGGSITQWAWNFGDGGTSTQQNPTHNYASTGPFNVTLVVTSSNGCIDSIMKVMNIVYAQPHADFTMDSATSCAGNTVHFTDNLSSAPASTVTNYFWNFGDGGTSTLQNPSHGYPTPGTYQVKHWVTSAAGCMSDTMTKTVTVVALPTASFTVSGLPLCATSTVTFTSTSTTGAGTITQYGWTVNGNPTGGNNASITYSPPAPGNYTVILTVTTSNGCSNQTTQTINVNAKPAANFNFTGACLPSGSTQFTDQSTVAGGSITQWAWNFGDGGTSTQQNPTHNYASTGPFNVTLVVTSSNGCIDSIMKVMNIVYAQPHADFTMDSATSCAGNTVHFTDNLSSAPASTVTNYFWNFGDGGTSTLQNPSHGYPTPGTYQVKHWVTSAAGCMSDTMTKTVTVVALPTASFTVSGLPLCATSTVTFTSTSTTGAGTITQYGWTVNGNPTGGNNASITYSPPASGNYTVILTVTTSNGCSNQTTQTINVNAKPAANFNFTGACLPSGSTQFTDQSTVTGGSITQWAWNFGDGGTSTQQNPTHNYASTGPFNVTLVVTSANGCIDSITKVMNTVFAQPQAAFNAPAEVCNGSVAGFTDQSTAPNSSITQWAWNFGDGGTSTQQNPTHTYSVAGTYTVTLNTVSAAGCPSTTVTHNVIVNPLPTANFNVSVPNCINQTITFADISVPNAGNIVQWSWNFGDGGTSTQQNPQHGYTATGSYNATLQVTTNKGCVSTVLTKQVVVSPLPVANFGIPQSCLFDPNSQFTDSSTISDGTQNLFTYLWNFGDPNATPGNPNTSTLKNPLHKYTAAGPYNVTLTVTSGNGCATSITKPFFVNGGTPVPSFTVQGNTSFCSGGGITLTDNSSVTPGNLINVEIYWDYTADPTIKTTDNNPTAGKNYSHTYPEFGSPASRTVTIRYVASSGQNCVQYIDRTITLLATPTIQFNTIAGVCKDVPGFQVTQASVVNGLPGTGTFSGPGISSGGFFDPNAAGAGTKTIRYTYNATNGCSNYKDQTIDVFALPTVNAGLDRGMLQYGSTVLQASATGNGLTYLWTPNVAINNPAILQPTVSPPTDQVYTLTVTTSDGCKASDEVLVSILKAPVIPNIFSPNGDGIHDKWDIPYLSTYVGCTVDIYNRYGQRIYHSIGYDNPWDGTVNGKQVPVGTYYYVIDPKNGRSKMSGYVDVIR